MNVFYHRLLAAVLLPLFFSRVVAGEAADDLATYLVQNHYGAVRTQVDKNNKQILKMKINGKLAEMELDTGAPSSGVSRGFAWRAGLPVIGKGQQLGGMGASIIGQENIARVSTLTINDWNINHFKTIDVYPAQSASSWGVEDGLFGYDLLQLNSAIIVVGGGGILVRPGPRQPVSIDRFMIQRGYTSVPLEISKNRLLCRGTLNGQPLLALLDCGGAYTCFNDAFLKKIGIISKANGQVMTGLDGRPIPAGKFYPREVSLGKFESTPYLMFCMRGAIFNIEKIDALIGFDFMTINHAVLDTGASKLWLKGKSS